MQRAWHERLIITVAVIFYTALEAAVIAEIWRLIA